MHVLRCVKVSNKAISPMNLWFTVILEQLIRGVVGHGITYYNIYLARFDKKNKKHTAIKM